MSVEHKCVNYGCTLKISEAGNCTNAACPKQWISGNTRPTTDAELETASCNTSNVECQKSQDVAGNAKLETVAKVKSYKEQECTAEIGLLMRLNGKSPLNVGDLLVRQDQVSAVIADRDAKIAEKDKRIADLEAERVADHALIKCITGTISNAIGGGSEMFIKYGEGFCIDPKFVSTFIRERRENHHNVMSELVATKAKVKELEAKLAAANAEIERMTPNFVAYDYLESPARAEIAEAALQASNDENATLRSILEDISEDISNPPDIRRKAHAALSATGEKSS